MYTLFIKKGMQYFLIVFLIVLFAFFADTAEKNGYWKNSQSQTNQDEVNSNQERIEPYNKVIITEDDKPFLPDDITNGTIDIGVSIDQIMSSVNYLRKSDSFLFSQGPKLVFSKKMNEYSYFDSMVVNYETYFFSNYADRIQLTKLIKNKSEQNLEYTQNQFLDYCYTVFGEPNKKYLVKLFLRNSDDILYTSNLLWTFGDRTFIATYYSKRMRDEALKYMGENRAKQMFGAYRIFIQSKQKGIETLENIRKAENEDEEYLKNQTLYFSSDKGNNNEPK